MSTGFSSSMTSSRPTGTWRATRPPGSSSSCPRQSRSVLDGGEQLAELGDRVLGVGASGADGDGGAGGGAEGHDGQDAGGGGRPAVVAELDVALEAGGGLGERA